MITHDEIKQEITGNQDLISTKSINALKELFDSKIKNMCSKVPPVWGYKNSSGQYVWHSEKLEGFHYEFKGYFGHVENAPTEKVKISEIVNVLKLNQIDSLKLKLVERIEKYGVDVG